MSEAIYLDSDLKRLWRKVRTFDEDGIHDDPYLSVQCRTCDNTFNRFVTRETLLRGCKHCTPNRVDHHLAAAFVRHSSNKLLRSHLMIREERWALWVINPYQPEVHPLAKEWVKSGSELTLKEYTGWQPPEINEEAEWEYLHSTSGLSYEQWFNRPDHLQHHLRSDLANTVYLGQFNEPLAVGESVLLAGGEVKNYHTGIKPVQILRRVNT